VETAEEHHDGLDVCGMEPLIISYRLLPALGANLDLAEYNRFKAGNKRINDAL
jgi:hypothetical protein